MQHIHQNYQLIQNLRIKSFPKICDMPMFQKSSIWAEFWVYLGIIGDFWRLIMHKLCRKALIMQQIINYSVSIR